MNEPGRPESWLAHMTSWYKEHLSSERSHKMSVGTFKKKLIIWCNALGMVMCEDSGKGQITVQTSPGECDSQATSHPSSSDQHFGTTVRCVVLRALPGQGFHNFVELTSTLGRSI